MKAIIHLFSTERIRLQEQMEPGSETNSVFNHVLIDYWLIEGPRSYRQSILSDKIRSLDISRNYSHWM
ncbi:hypothetical protein [Lihuaxuella thermophila]|uniref:Uncharacterized protein n=1 Tax=Lihuaxuella thermophila TaxID=1173111 RepID=A0A1H8HTP5_9BACL|nr:hypothetical protein [Lihuaxuella thermophila]SEN59484.1 hypothetical protein SAMN05444955_11536 [Lihuaxuella thermophila]